MYHLDPAGRNSYKIENGLRQIVHLCIGLGLTCEPQVHMNLIKHGNMALDADTCRKWGGNDPHPRWRRLRRRAHRRERLGLFSFCPHSRWRLPWALSRLRPAPRPRLLSVLPSAPSQHPVGAEVHARRRASRAGCGRLTWRQWRRLQRPRGMGAAVAESEAAKAAAHGRRRAPGPWPRRTWSSTMW